ncbi:MAG: lysophospholipid acyltransferase family protein [Desulfobacca sp.]|uniref:lysophospholipid acyltransferase family protein n=1 Tax=Desulfobacca sp. TaxID=2067990 RepID=UPI00404A927F
MRLRHPSLLRLVPTVAKLWLDRVFATCRQVTVNQEAERQLVAQGHSVLLTCWHGQLAYPFYKFPSLARPIVLLASPSVDGDLISRVAERYGARVFAGSRHKGGLAALYKIAAAMRQGHHGGIIADGSRGPYHHLKKGVVFLAREAGAAVLPVAVASSRKLILNTWDRFEIILPYSQVALVYGEPFFVPPDCSLTTLAAYHRALERRLLDLFHFCQHYPFP